MTTKANRKAWLLAAAMGLTAVFSAAFAPRPQPLAQERAGTPLESLIPERFGDWQLDPAAAALIRPAFEQARQFQMYDQVLERTYVNGAGHSVMLSVAYGRQQSVGLQMHRPEVCYKAGGFHIDGLASGQIPLDAGAVLPVTRLFASMEGRPEPITYWRLLGDEVVKDETQFRLRQLTLGATRAIPDGMLVRVSSIGDDLPATYAMQADFVKAMARALTPAQRSRVIGLP